METVNENVITMIREKLLLALMMKEQFSIIVENEENLNRKHCSLLLYSTLKSMTRR